MQHVAEQHGIEALILDGKMPAIVRKIINSSGGGVAADVQPNHRGTEQAL
jgi:hypothetical protein